jgi:hypothetical protein
VPPEILSRFDGQVCGALWQGNVAVVGEARIPAGLFKGLAPFEQFRLKSVEDIVPAKANQIGPARAVVKLGGDLRATHRSIPAGQER